MVKIRKPLQGYRDQFFYPEKNDKNYTLKNKYNLVTVSFEEDCGFVFGNQMNPSSNVSKTG